VTKKISHPAELSYSQLLNGVAELLDQARKYSVRSINAIMTQTYWEVGQDRGARATGKEAGCIRRGPNRTACFGPHSEVRQGFLSK
jgi:hypothetical protein